MSDVEERLKYARTLDDAMRIVKEAAWEQVRDKAKRLKDEGRVLLDTNEINFVNGSVEGDNGTYGIEIYRENENDNKITRWSCGCPWGHYATMARTRSFKKYENRPCSHIIAAMWQSWSQPLTSDPQQTLFKRMRQRIKPPPEPVINYEVAPEDMVNAQEQEPQEQPVQMTLPGMEQYNVPAPGLKMTKWKKI